MKIVNREDKIREIQERYRELGRTLNEFQRRHWAALEAMRLGRGGITLVSEALRISPNTIKRGMEEISAGQAAPQSRTGARIRKPGGGRKSKKTTSERTRSKQTAVSPHPEYRTSGPSGANVSNVGRQPISPISAQLNSKLADNPTYESGSVQPPLP